MDALKEETAIVFDFCMCNPPFFANQLEAKVSFVFLKDACWFKSKADNVSYVSLDHRDKIFAAFVHCPEPGIYTDSNRLLIGFYPNLCLSCCSLQGVNSRNSRRPPPSSVNTGGVTEIMAEGGELEFVKRIIHDSLQLKKRLR